jgi:hypothetical protein
VDLVGACEGWRGEREGGGGRRGCAGRESGLETISA